MRLIRKLLVLAIVGYGGVMAFNYVSENGWPSRPSAASFDADTAKRQAARVANQAAATASDAALTAKIKSKMALDDHVKARAINVDTAGSVVTLSGVVASKDERDRAVRLARETAGVTRVDDKLRIAQR